VQEDPPNPRGGDELQAIRGQPRRAKFFL